MWIAGTYDEADFDEVVDMATSVVGSHQKSPVVQVIRAIVVKFVEFADARSRSKTLPRDAQPPASTLALSSCITRRGPPAT